METWKKSFQNCLFLENEASLEKQLESDLEMFNESFKKRAKEFHWEFLSRDYFKGLSIAVDKFFPTGGQILSFWHLVKINQIEGMKGYCFRRPFEELSKNYADQDIKNIRLDTFQDRVTILNRYFPTNSRFNIIYHLRFAVKRKGESIEKQLHRSTEIEAMRQELDNVADDAPCLAAAREFLLMKLTKEKADLEEERLKLCGPTGFDGEINRAYQLKQQGALEYDYHLLQARLTVIAQFDNRGQIIGGRLLDIEQDLHPQEIDRAARILIQRQARFYETLTGDVEESEEEAASRSMTLVELVFDS